MRLQLEPAPRTSGLLVQLQKLLPRLEMLDLVSVIEFKPFCAAQGCLYLLMVSPMKSVALTAPYLLASGMVPFLFPEKPANVCHIHDQALATKPPASQHIRCCLQPSLFDWAP